MSVEVTQRDIERIDHILDAADFLATLVGESRRVFDASRERRHTVERLLEIVGEAAGQMSDGFAAAYPDLDLAGARDLRNVIIHGYMNVDYDLLWDAAAASVPALAAGLRAAAGLDPPTENPGPAI